MLRQTKDIIKHILPDKVVDGIYHLKRSGISYRRWPVKYNEDGIITVHYPAFMDDKKFVEAYESNAWIIRENPEYWETRWRMHTTAWVANRAKDLEGDFVECGVNKGFSAKFAMDFVDFTKLDKTFYLMDTFRGVVEECLTDGEKAQGKTGGGYEECYEEVVETFKDYKNAKIIRGAIPGTLPLVKSEKIAYIYMDMNAVMPEIAAAEYFWDKLVPGGMIILDDYGHLGFEEQRKAFDEFARKKGIQILCLPTGQGLIMK